jgi:hypothetical protein
VKSRWLSSLFGLVVVALVAATYVFTERHGLRRALSDRTLSVELEGAPVAVFDTANDSCEEIDIPDAPARAFRDYQGTVHLVASHWVMRASLGPTLENVKHNCQIAYRSNHDRNPADFDDDTWLDAFYSIDGKRVVALGHMEYHGSEHEGMCGTNIDGNLCWYNADTLHMSEDGGYHFASFRPPANFVAGLPYKYEANNGPEGYSVDTNIVRAGKWYYAMVTGWRWPPNCTDGKGPNRCLVPAGACPIRTSDLLVASSWRGWNGTDFAVSFVNPYQDPVIRPADFVCTPVTYMDCVNGINIHEPSHLFIATLGDPFNTEYGPKGAYLSTSTDLIHWSKPVLVVTIDQLRAKEPTGRWDYMYFSLIDPASKDPNFATITDAPYLYYVRSDESHPPYARVLFRQKIRLSLK